MKDLIQDSELSSIELAKFIKSLKPLTVSKDKFDQLKSNLISNDKLQRINQILTGLEQEDEFAILCRLLKTCTSIVKLDQLSIVENHDEVIPDFLATFEPGCTIAGKRGRQVEHKFNCFIEIKSCQKETFKISAKDLIKRQKFADRFNLPLLFAIRFTMFGGDAAWAIIESKHLNSINRKVGPTDVINSLRHIIFDDYFVMPMPNLHVVRIYDSSSSDKGVRHNKYGLMKKTLVLSNDNQFQISQEQHIPFNVFLDTFELKEVKIITDKNTTCQISTAGIQVRSLTDILFRINRLFVDDFGAPIFDATRTVSQLDSQTKQHILIDRDFVESCILTFNAQAQFFCLMAFEEPDHHLQKLIKLKN